MDPAFRAHLSASALFGGLVDDDLAAICALLEPRAVPAGTVIVQAGALGTELYFIEDGEVLVTAAEKAAGELETTSLARLGPGDCFGEMALIEIAPRSASVRAVRDCRLHVLRSRDLRRLQHERPHAFVLLILNLARELSRRLRRAGEEIAALRDTVRALEASAPDRQRAV